MSSSGLNWEPLLHAWLNKRTSTEIGVIKPLFSNIFPSFYTWSYQNLKFKIPVLEVNIVSQVRITFHLMVKFQIYYKIFNFSSCVLTKCYRFLPY